MEASSSPIVMIGGQRSNNTTPHQHHYYSTPEQPSSFLSTLSYLPSPTPQDASHHLPQHHQARRSSLHHTGGGNNLQYGGGAGSKTTTPLHHLQNHPQSSRATPRSRGQSPSVNSLGAESNIMMDTSSLSPLNHHHHPISHLSHHPHMNIGHGHNHLHDDSHIHINCDNSSHSISPPNSNSNTTISCGSGNSTSANIGVPTSGSRSKGEDHHHNNLRRNPMQNNNNNINRSNKPSNNNNKEKEDYENYRNRNGGVGGGGSERTSKNHHNKSSLRGKKSILEEDCPLEKSDNSGVQLQNNTNKFKQRPPFINPNQEFLPICDALFNMISLAAYFCDCVFDVLTVYSWYKISVETEEDKIFELSAIQQQQRNRLAGASSGEIEELRSSMPKELMWQWSLLGLIFIFFSCALSQCLSFKWYKESERRGQRAPDGSDLSGPPAPCSSSILVLMHVGVMGVLWRYFKLFIPVDLRFVKNEVRDLCLLRLIHAFCQAAPMLLLQLYLIWHEPSLETVSDLTKVSTALSLFSVCWALASFSKHIRRQNVHKLVLTWLGVIFQFFWRLGTVTSRFLALSLYAIAYQYWVFIVLFLHWFCMLLWLISPKNIFHGEKMSPLRKVSYSAIVAVVYTFCYINVQETNSRVKVIIYYVTMFFENSLLLGVWLIAVRYEDEIWFRRVVTYLVFLCFFGGLTFMALYYKYFHVKKLSYVYDAESSIYRNTSSIGGCSLMNDNGSMVATISGIGDGNGDYETASVARGKSNGVIMAYTGSRGGGNNSLLINSNKKKTPTKFNSKRNGERKNNNKNLSESEKKSNEENENGKRTGPPYTKTNGLHVHQPNVPGVFNCRFHPAMKRKKKKPTTFVPPPAVRSQTTNNNGGGSSDPLSQNSSPSSTAQQQQMQKQGQPTSLNSPQNFDDTTRIMLDHDHDDHHHESLGNMVMRQSPHEQIMHGGGGAGDDMPYPHNEISLNHQHHNISSSPSHHHLVEYGSPQCSGVDGGGGVGSSSLNAHYDLPEYDPTNNVGSNGSQSSSYGPIVSGLYHHPNMHAMMMAKSASSSSTGRMMMAPAPFWRRPLSLTMGSENEGSVSSRIDIQQKLQEKKQQQLAELREIEEEIKQGKLKRPELHEICPQPVNQRQPIPVEKKQPWFGDGSGAVSGSGGVEHCPEMSTNAMHDLSQRPPMIPPSDQGGIILDPHQYLMYHHPGQNPSGIVIDSASGFYYNPDWPPSSSNYYEPLYQNGADSEVRGEGDTSPPSGGVSGGDGSKGRFGDRRRRHHNRGYFDPSSRESIYKSYRIPSDIDSQMSLPRSYTLPREFKYKRKFRKPVKTENFLPSTNSSDGDVDSGEDPDAYSEVRPYPLPLPSMHHIQNETSGTPPQQSSSSGEVMGAITPAAASSSLALGIGSAPAATRQSRKIPNGRPRHKLHETKL